MEIKREKLIEMLEESHLSGQCNAGCEEPSYSTTKADVIEQIDKYETDIETKANDRALKIKCLEEIGDICLDNIEDDDSVEELIYGELLESMDLYAETFFEQRMIDILDEHDGE